MVGAVDLALLHTLRTVARAGSFRRAASELHLTQPAVTKQIQALEREVGERLLDRRRPLALTHAGEVLVRYAEQIAGLVRNAENEIGDLQRTGASGRVALGASYSVADFLPRLLGRCRTRFPQVTLTVDSDWPDAIVRRVRERELDLGLVVLTSPRPAEPEEIAAIPLTESGMVIIAPPDTALTKGRFANMKQLAAQPWILNHRSCVYRLYLDRIFAEHGLHMQVAVDGVGVELQCRLVELGLGLALIPESFLVERGRRRKVKVLRVRGVEPRSLIGLVYRRDKYLHGALRSMIVALQDIFPEANLDDVLAPSAAP
jgi:DNA-binding transcriptional LysR family regulator